MEKIAKLKEILRVSNTYPDKLFVNNVRASLDFGKTLITATPLLEKDDMNLIVVERRGKTYFFYLSYEDARRAFIEYDDEASKRSVRYTITSARGNHG